MLHLTPFLTVYCCVLAAVFGACMGSFLNCMAWRVVHGESVLRGRSHCDACGHVLGARDLVPIVSYLASGRLADGLLGGFGVALGLLAVVTVLEKRMGREAMGGGDLKLLFVTGLFFGWKGNLLCLILACIFGIVFGLLAAGRAFPFAASCRKSAVLGAYLRRMGAENDDKDRCIVSIGHRSTHLYIYHGAAFDSRREIDVGGRLIDEQIAEHCGVDIHLAHSYMRSDYNGVLEADYAREAYSRLAVEIMKAVNFYNYNNRDRELHDLYICGGGGGIEPMLRTIVETTRLTLHPVSELLSQQLSTEEPWTYLRAIGGVSEGIKGGLA